MQACTGHRTVATARLVVRRGQGVAGKVFEEGRPLCVDDYDADPRISHDFLDIAHADGTRAALGAPMTVRGHAIGVAMSWRRSPAAYTEADIRAMTTLANFAAIAVENARLYEAQRRTVEGLQQANRRLESQNEVLRRATEVHDELMRLVLEGVPLAELVAGVARLLDADVATLDAGRRAMAVSGPAGAALQRRMVARLDARAAGRCRGPAARPRHRRRRRAARVPRRRAAPPARAARRRARRAGDDHVRAGAHARAGGPAGAHAGPRRLPLGPARRQDRPTSSRRSSGRARCGSSCPSACASRSSARRRARATGAPGDAEPPEFVAARVARAGRRARRLGLRRRVGARRGAGLAGRAAAARRRRSARSHGVRRQAARRALPGDGRRRGRQRVRGRHRRPAGGLRAGAGRAQRRADRRRRQPRRGARRARHHALPPGARRPRRPARLRAARARRRARLRPRPSERPDRDDRGVPRQRLQPAAHRRARCSCTRRPSATGSTRCRRIAGLDFARQRDRFEAQLAISILRSLELQEVAAP